ncbi:MAG: type VI secretion system baseplate subunit TssK [Holosporales bacterium]|jgi:type VI secretion system protein ImpJ|nr:type VI secretion system baseplate subunit TssK [Holosporales bacterium]
MAVVFERPIPLAVQWHEGMLLSPQHFQQTAIRTENLIHHHFQLSRPDGYGVCDFKIDSAALSAGTVLLLHLEALTPDGTLIQYDATQQEDKVFYDLKPLLQIAGNEVLRLYVAVAKQRPQEDAIQDAHARYASLEGEEVRDNNTGDNPIRIPRLRPIVRLLTEPELSGRFSAFPLIELRPDEKGPTPTPYIAPCLYVPEALKDICREVVKSLREKINYFAERCYAISTEGSLILRPLIQGVLPLEALLVMPKISPFILYQTMLQTVAHVLALTPSQYLAGLPEYQHENLHAVFTALQNRVQLALENLKQDYYTIPFNKDGQEFRLPLSSSWTDHRELIIGFRKSPGMNENELLDWMRGAQIAAPSKVATVKDNRVLGAARKVVSAELELGIATPQDVVLLSIDPGSPYLNTQEDLCVFNSGKSICPQDAALYVRRT